MREEKGGFFALGILERYGLWAALALAAAYGSYFLALSLLKFRSYAYSDFDLAIYQQVLYNTAHGDFFYSSLRGGVFFKDHLSLVLGLLVPFFVLFPRPEFLLVLQALFIGSGAVPLFLIARKKLNGTFGVAFALAYLLYPPTAHANLFEFHPEKLAIPLLLWGLYFFFARRFRPYLLFLLLAISCREDISLVVALLGLYALWYNRRQGNEILPRGGRRWFLVPFLIGLAYFIFALTVVIPSFNPDGGYIYFQSLYGSWGSSLGEVLLGVISRPRQFLETVLSWERLQFLGLLLAPLLFLPLLSLSLLLVAAPLLAANLLSGSMATYGIYHQYSSTLVPFLFTAAVLGARRLMGTDLPKRTGGILAAGLVLAGMASAVAFGPHFNPSRSPFFHPEDREAGLQRDERDRIRDYMLAQVPENAGVIATFDFLSHLSHRRELQSAHYLYMGFDDYTNRTYVLPDAVEYALFDLRNRTAFLVFFRWEVTGNDFPELRKTGRGPLIPFHPAVDFRNTMMETLAGGGFEALLGIDDFVLFHRTGRGSLRARPVSRSPAQRSGPLLFERGLRFNSISVSEPREIAELEGLRAVDVEVSAIIDQPRYFLIDIILLDASGRPAKQVQRALGGPITPSFSWAPGNAQSDSVVLVLPEELKGNDFALVLGVLEMPLLINTAPLGRLPRKSVFGQIRRLQPVRLKTRPEGFPSGEYRILIHGPGA